ncbi:DHS-like NAD/FAD-binding domain-containing protein, partial [Cladochytrium replicatum]
MILADLRNLKDNDGALDTTARDAAETLELIKNVAASLRKSKRCVVVTGAGISVAAGIPDFRSKDGLFSQIKERYPSTVVTGQDLFDARLFKDPASIPIFYSFMGELKDLVAKATPTRSHHFLKMLDQRSQLLRCYTQNIDCLESSLHLSSDLTLDKRARIVQLHGDLKNVVCTMCARLFAFSEAWNDKYFKFGTAPPCPRCSDADQVRTALGKRNLPVGTLRPNVVLYNEHHPKGDQIADAASFDMKRKPDFLIVMGTSLKVFGIKRLVKDLARCIRDSYSTTPMNPLSSESDPANHPSKRSAVFGDNKRPRIILINQTELAAHSEWDDVFDVHIRADSDDAVKLIE